jgi:uncharacterized protein YbjT (DUF2867 family)
MTTTLVLGGTGTTGRRIADHLRSAGHLVRTASRTGSDVPLDLDAPATWPMALDGITAAYLVEPAVRAGQDRLARFAEAAIEAGVRRLVLLSAARAAEPTHPLYGVEQTVRGSGVGWTVLHPNWFAQNFSEGPWVRSVLDGTLALPAGDGRTPFIDADDIAAVAAAALTDERHHGRTYELTGPEPITFREATDIISRVSGRTVEYVDVDPSEHTKRQIVNGIPPETAELLTDILVTIANGHAGAPTDHVQQALGRPARSFATYAAQATADGRWKV